jgi:two-component system, sensor histidine kinase and response regulator
LRPADPGADHDRQAIDRLRRLGGVELLTGMTTLFRTHGAARVRSMVEGATAGDLQQVARAGHSLKSTAANVGGVALAALAAQVEASAEAGDTEAVGALVPEAERRLAELLEWLAEQLAEPESESES